jgi:glyoxylase-like metal-dependent hydrolase (beta-lactamase superfamily II)
MLALVPAILLLQGCVASSHDIAPTPSLGHASSSAAMERLIEQPGPVLLETINSADWAVSLGGLLNLDSAAARAAKLKEHDEPISVYAHVLRHPQRGNFLVDSGVARTLVDNPGAVGMSWIMRKGMHIDKMILRKSTAQIIAEMPGKLSGVFFTHLHIDHISGMPDIGADVPLYIGPMESSAKNLMNLVSKGSTDSLLEGKHSLLEWPFQADPQGKFDGIVDVFDDGSVFAISVPGHTAGSVAYLVRTPQGPILLTGDTSHTRWGWEHGVEPGDYTRDQASNLRNLMRLKALVAAHPAIEVRFGHQR